MSDLHALLIGVDHYFPNTLTGRRRTGEIFEYRYPNLGGCVRDVRAMEGFLRGRMKVPGTHIHTLTASTTGGARPAEEEAAWPTYANMVAAFEDLTERATGGDLVFVHYSGHGGRAVTAYPTLKGTDGIDEALVPTDIGEPGSRYLRDLELAELLQRMVDKDLVVTVVLDCCHAGGATRGRGAALDPVPRGVAGIDTREPPKDSLVARPETLASKWQAMTTTRSLKPQGGLLPDPQGYTLLAACRDQEFAYEATFDGVRSGALTYHFLGALALNGDRRTYRTLHNRILGPIRGRFPEQNPMLLGEADRQVFGSATIQPVRSVTVLEVEGEQVRLQAGQAQGVRRGALFAIYPADALDIGRHENRLATVEIVELGATDALSKVIERSGDAAIEVGAQAVMTSLGGVRFARGVFLATRDDLPADIDQASALGRAKAALEAGGSGWVKLAEEGEGIHYQVAVDEEGQYEIWDAGGVPVSNLRPALPVDDPEAPVKLVGRLEHLTKFHHILALTNHDDTSPLAGKLEAELLGRQGDYQPGEPREPEPFDDANLNRLRVGEWVFLRIRNLLPPHPDPNVQNHNVLNVAVVNLRPGWGVTKLFPENVDFHPLDPGAERTLDLRAGLPDGTESGTDVLKVFATLGSARFDWIELPDLDQPAPKRGVTRSGAGPTSEFEVLMRDLTAERPPAQTRALTSVARASEGWTVEQIEVRIERNASTGGDR